MALNAVAFHDGIEVDGVEMCRMLEGATGGASGMVGPSTSFAAAAQGSPDLTVSVAEGGALVPADGSGLDGTYFVYNDAALTSPLFDATGGSVRTDRLVLRVDAGLAELEVIQGTPGSASPPAITGDNVIPICQVVFPVSTSTITTGMIVDERTFAGSPILVCTSSTRPASPFAGLRIYETDTKRELTYAGGAWADRLAVGTTPQRMGGGLASGNIGSAAGDSGSITSSFLVTHGLGWTPQWVVATGKTPISGAGIAAQILTDSFGATTFRARILDNDGAAITGGTAITFSWIAGRAL